jgi:hypothetical protein
MGRKIVNNDKVLPEKMTLTNLAKCPTRKFSDVI